MTAGQQKNLVLNKGFLPTMMTQAQENPFPLK
jgi:hypothetical protein